MAEVDGAISRATMICRKVDGLNVGRALGHVVDQASCRGHATFDGRNSLEKFDSFLVLKRQILLARDGQAVHFESRSEIEGKTTNLIVAVVAHRHVVVPD